MASVLPISLSQCRIPLLRRAHCPHDSQQYQHCHSAWTPEAEQTTRGLDKLYSITGMGTRSDTSDPELTKASTQMVRGFHRHFAKYRGHTSMTRQDPENDIEPPQLQPKTRLTTQTRPIKWTGTRYSANKKPNQTK
jgi:hypothetical protein